MDLSGTTPLLTQLAPPKAAMGASSANARGGLAPWQLARVRRHIDRHLASHLTNACLAGLARLSADHFARAFKVSVGCPPHAYVVTRRVERAKSLMLSSNLPLSQIALATGFVDQPHLTRHFRARVGASPASWQRRFRTATKSTLEPSVGARAA